MKNPLAMPLLLLLCGCSAVAPIERVSLTELETCRAAHADFIDHTRLAEPALLAQWKAAQAKVAHFLRHYQNLAPQPSTLTFL